MSLTIEKLREIVSSRSTDEIANNILLMVTVYSPPLYSISSVYALPFRVLRIDYDNEGNPIYFTTYEDWLKYVRDSNLEEIVLPYVKPLDLEEVLKDLGWKYKIEIKRNLTPVDQEVKVIYLSDCSLVKRVEYIVLSLTLINGLGEEIIPVCGEFTMEKYKTHLLQQLYWLSK
ncbi:hypothetical protein [Saccharolobus caldissimus]|uniref:Uncharacterized protein n=1 Tax=Saccharolobus caldissimus TaxID=1702097 RepID=A0AAQ4CVG1_9CREN|nr:hypothetical protein [Saccharolobus caldissimus]BDB99792.1 hypothetical protein SACC_28090 [Saccharolobus caldissimus]